MDADKVYASLREHAESLGFVGDHADELLRLAAESMAEDPRNEQE